jgi:hypothetical protein
MKIFVDNEEDIEDIDDNSSDDENIQTNQIINE